MSALTPKTFDSKVTKVGTFPAEPKDIKNEPMFFNSDYQFALTNAGPITKSFLLSLPAGWQENSVFDSRCHMLMPGWYPAIPGYHHDDVPRPEIPTGQHFLTAGQPDYENPRYHSEHIMGLVNAEIAPTQFIVGKCDMKAVPEGGLIYRQWHKEIEEKISAGAVEVMEAENNTLYYFDCFDFHTGQKAKSNGWRWFGRISRNTERKPSNEIRRQVQVYLEFPMEGW